MSNTCTTHTSCTLQFLSQRHSHCLKLQVTAAVLVLLAGRYVTYRVYTRWTRTLCYHLLVKPQHEDFGYCYLFVLKLDATDKVRNIVFSQYRLISHKVVSPHNKLFLITHRTGTIIYKMSTVLYSLKPINL